MGKTGDLEKDWYLLKNGMLMYCQNKDSDEELKKYANNVVNLSQFAESYGMKFLYVELSVQGAERWRISDRSSD